MIARRALPDFKGGLHRAVRDLHLYVGLFVSPFVLVFAASVFFLVHPRQTGAVPNPALERVVSDLPLPAGLEKLTGRERIDALRPALERAGARGEVGWVQHLPNDNLLIVPVTVPGRLTTVRINLNKHKAVVEERRTGLADALVTLHKSPGPHLAAIRMNWFPMRVWFWLSDATVYLLLFTTLSGLSLWYALRADRRVGFALLVAGAATLFGLVYAVVH